MKMIAPAGRWPARSNIFMKALTIGGAIGWAEARRWRGGGEAVAEAGVAAEA